MLCLKEAGLAVCTDRESFDVGVKGAGEHGKCQGRQPPHPATLPGQPQDARDAGSSQVGGGQLPVHHIPYEEEQTMNSLMRFRVNSPKVVHETIDNEVVIIDFDTGNYYSLDGVGAYVWGCIENEHTLAEIVEEVARQFIGDGIDLETVIPELIGELQQDNLVVIVQTSQMSEEAGQVANNVAKSAKHPFEPPVLHRYTDMQELLLLDPIHEVDEAGWPSVTGFPRNW